MTKILLRLFDLEIKNKQIIKEKEQKLKAKLQARNNENNLILAKLQVARQKINNMEKHNKDLENIKMVKDSLQTTLKEIDANYQNLKAEKDILNVEHSNLQKTTRIWSKLF